MANHLNSVAVFFRILEVAVDRADARLQASFQLRQAADQYDKFCRLSTLIPLTRPFSRGERENGCQPHGISVLNRPELPTLRFRTQSFQLLNHATAHLV